MIPATLDNEVPLSLISELAKGNEDASAIFIRFGYSSDEAIKLLGTADFKRAFKAARDQWLAADNLEARIRSKSLFAMEELLQPHYKLAVDPDVSPTARNEAVKIFKSLAGMDRKLEDGPVAGGFSITLNLGAGLETKEIHVEPQVTPALSNED